MRSTRSEWAEVSGGSLEAIWSYPGNPERFMVAAKALGKALDRASSRHLFVRFACASGRYWRNGSSTITQRNKLIESPSF